jgi:Ca2+-binding EF-hand superfamily protein
MASIGMSPLGRGLASALVPLALAGCSSMANPFTTGSAFSNASIVDRTFIGAAQTWDLNKDSLVTCDEWKQYATTALREADVNGDGALSSDEFARMAKSDRLFDVADLKYFDANGDGKVTVEEISVRNRAFQLLDKNNDCQIARDESAQVVQVEKVKDTSLTPEQQMERARR